jgi:hypothetical protein
MPKKAKEQTTDSQKSQRNCKARFEKTVKDNSLKKKIRKEKAIKAAIQASVVRRQKSLDLKRKRMQEFADRMFDSVYDDKNLYCCHVKVGSSNVHRLLSGTYDARRAHQYEYYGECQSSGSVWEAYMEKLGELETTEGKKIRYEIVKRRPSAPSRNCKFISATSDFLIRFKTNFDDWKFALM